MNTRFINHTYSPTTLLLLRWIDTCSVEQPNGTRLLFRDPDTMAMLEFNSIGSFMDELDALQTSNLVIFTPKSPSIPEFHELKLTELGERVMAALRDLDSDDVFSVDSVFGQH